MNDYFEGRRFFKVFNAANYRDGWEYDSGINDMRNFKNYEGKSFISYFTDIKNIFFYLAYGPCFREVKIPSTVPFIYTSEDIFGKRYEVEEFSFNYIELGNIKVFDKYNIDWLIENGADISAYDYYIFEWALMYNFPVFYYLQEKYSGTDIWDYKINQLMERGFL